MPHRFLAVALLGFAAAYVPAASGSQLEIVNTAVHQYEGGPGVPGGFEFFPGDPVFFSFRIAGFRSVEEDDEERIRLSYGIEVLDPDGVRLAEGVTGKIETELTPEDRKKQWLPVVRHDVAVPPSALSGAYRLAVEVKDELSGATAQHEATFQVRGRYVEPSDTLVVRNFRFLRAETATEALAVAAYHPGDSVWARFDITGYEFGDLNRFSIDYGLTVLRASGKLLYTQEVAAAEERESYYPQRHIPGSLSLNLTPDLDHGAYTILLRVRDRIGDQICEIRQVFQVE